MFIGTGHKVSYRRLRVANSNYDQDDIISDRRPENRFLGVVKFSSTCNIHFMLMDQRVVISIDQWSRDVFLG